MQANVSLGTRPRPPATSGTPIGAFPVAGNKTNIERKESIVPVEQPPLPSLVLPHKQPNGSAIARIGTRDMSLQHTHVVGSQPQSPASIRFCFASDPPSMAVDWKPTLSLDDISPGSSPSTLKTRESYQRPDLKTAFYLESHYMIRQSLPRSFFTIMAQNSIQPCFVFDFPVGDKWWGEISGLRKSAYIDIKAENSSERWELHLKPTRDGTNIFGYICKHGDLANLISKQKYNLLKARRLPLVLDLDDTLVRLVGSERTRYVSEENAAKVPKRVRTLRDGRQVVLTEFVEEFLEWASKLYEISVCSLGEQSYVDQVAEVLDPMRTRIRGARYSARQEYDFLNASPSTAAHTASAGPPGDAITNGTSVSNVATSFSASATAAAGGAGNIAPTLSTAAITNAAIIATQPPSPPKDLSSLYAFCISDRPYSDGLPEIGGGFDLPLVLDDLTLMWPSQQHDNVIVVKERKNSGVWTVNLFPMVYHVLNAVHQEFFRTYDAWDRARAAALASITIPSRTPGSLTVNGNESNCVNGQSPGQTPSAIDFTVMTPAKKSFLDMPIPSAVGCYKEWLRGSLRDQISLTYAAPPGYLIAAVEQQQQQQQHLHQQHLHQQQQQQQQQQPPQQQPPPQQPPQQQPSQQQPSQQQ
ncbi:hypothetical protein BGZ50_002247 [Haplosporangium sp. Z 11]|nr:hypothetical protein BGZ50_002247 [Haplosporangium sp. Z 11]